MVVDDDMFDDFLNEDDGDENVLMMNQNENQDENQEDKDDEDI